MFIICVILSQNMNDFFTRTLFMASNWYPPELLTKTPCRIERTVQNDLVGKLTFNMLKIHNISH